MLAALDTMVPRIDTPVLFPAPRGGYIDNEKFRHREWAPALRAAGIEHRRVNDMRHTFATWAIESGTVELPFLARIMGTSTSQLEDTYFRWLKRTDDQLRASFDAYDASLGTDWALRRRKTAMRMRGLEPPRGSESNGGKWRKLAFAGP